MDRVGSPFGKEVPRDQGKSPCTIIATTRLVIYTNNDDPYIRRPGKVVRLVFDMRSFLRICMGTYVCMHYVLLYLYVCMYVYT